MTKATILVVEDEFITGMDIQDYLTKMGYDAPAVVNNGEEAVKKAGELHPDLVLMDILLTGKMTGIEAGGSRDEKWGVVEG